MPNLRLSNEQAGRRIALLQSTLRAPAAAVQHAQQSQDIVARIEAPEQLSAVPRDLQALATENGIVLLGASYKPETDAANPETGQVDIGVRLKGSYRPLKKTIAALLEMHQSLALESLVMRRALSTDAVLEIDLKFNFYYRKRA